MERLGLLVLIIASLCGCASSTTSMQDRLGGKFPSELAVSADCYIPTFYQDETSRSGRSHGLNVQYNYDLCQALVEQFTLLAPTVFPSTRLLPESVVSFGGQLGGRYGVKTLTGYDKIVPSETRVVVPAVDNEPREASALPFLPLMSQARNFANSYAYKDELTQIMYDGGRLYERSEYFQALMAMSLDDGRSIGGKETTLLMVVSGQLLGESYAKAKRYEVDSAQTTSNIIGGILSAAAGGSYTSEYTTTKPRAYMTLLFVSPEGQVEYANVAGSLACEDPSDSARLLIGSAFVGGLKTLSEKGSCSGNALETLIFDR